MSEKLVYVGKVIDLSPIEGADFIECATVVCGLGGKWRGVVKKKDFSIGSLCVVFLPDSILPECDDYKFMEKHKWRVKMCRFKGAPSEVLIIPCPYKFSRFHVGLDITESYKVHKYFKPVPANMQGKARGEFPSFVPKTDEPNYQSAEGAECIEKLTGHPYYITEKADGSSTTAFKYKGKFGVCSRNWELERNENIGYWEIAIRYKLEDKLPEGYALQWETCGPKIQANPMGLDRVEGFAFSGYKIDEQRYLSMVEFTKLCQDLDFPTVRILNFGDKFDKEGVDRLGEGTYLNGKQREGVVVRSQTCLAHGRPLSFKVINLDYEK